MHVAIYGIFINAIISLSKINFEITTGLTIVLNIFCYIFTNIFSWICNVSIKVLRQQDALNHDMYNWNFDLWINFCDSDHDNIWIKIIDLSLQLVWLLKYFLIISCINWSTLIKSNVWDI